MKFSSVKLYMTGNSTILLSFVFKPKASSPQFSFFPKFFALSYFQRKRVLITHYNNLRTYYYRIR